MAIFHLPAKRVRPLVSVVLVLMIVPNASTKGANIGTASITKDHLTLIFRQVLLVTTPVLLIVRFAVVNLDSQKTKGVKIAEAETGSAQLF